MISRLLRTKLSYKELIRDNNSNTIAQLLNLIYLEKNYNIAYENAFFRNGNMILLTNPYTKNDLYYISTDIVSSKPKEAITKFLSEYSIMRIAGKGLNYINFGLILKLEELFAIPYEDFGLDENSNREYTVEKWLDKCENKEMYFNSFLEAYSKEMDYLMKDNPENLLLAKQDNVEVDNYFLPFSISTRIMDKVGFNSIFQNIKPEKCAVKSNRLQGNFQIYDSNSNNITKYESECMDEEPDFNSCKYIYAAIDNENKKYYYGNEVKKYYELSDQIKELCKFSEISQITDDITEDEIRSIKDKMECFKDALESIHPGINMMSITRYRLLHHILYLRLYNLNLSNSDIKEWIKLINHHDTLKYDIIQKSDLFKNTDNILYIPKDNLSSQATLRFINDRYILNHTRRGIDIFSQNISKVENKYYVNKKEIKELIFIFDNILSGTSTNNTIDYHLSGSNTNKKMMKYTCNNDIISIKDIISANKDSKISIFSIYASEDGKTKIKNNLSSKYKNLNINLLESLGKIKAKATSDDIELIGRIFGNEICSDKESWIVDENNYLIVREFNQPKKNIMPREIMDINKRIAIFCFKAEIEDTELL